VHKSESMATTSAKSRCVGSVWVSSLVVVVVTDGGLVCLFVFGESTVMGIYISYLGTKKIGPVPK